MCKCGQTHTASPNPNVKAGDKLTLEVARVITSNDKITYLEFKGATDQQNRIEHTTIQKHERTPEPICVGDKVRSIFDSVERTVWGIQGDMVWLSPRNLGGSGPIIHVTKLTKVC